MRAGLIEDCWRAMQSPTEIGSQRAKKPAYLLAHNRREAQRASVDATLPLYSFTLCFSNFCCSCLLLRALALVCLFTTVEILCLLFASLLTGVFVAFVVFALFDVHGKEVCHRFECLRVVAVDCCVCCR